MSRLKRLKSIDGVIQILKTIQMNQCSLSENDVNLLTDAIAKLNKLKNQKGLTDKHYHLEVTDIVILITSFFTR